MGLKHSARLIALGLVCLGAATAHALVLDGSGNITDWGIAPFNASGNFGVWDNGAPPNASGVNGIDAGQTGTIRWVEGNNAAPVDYPESPDFVPAPAAESNGEKFDVEFLGWRIVGTQLQALAITSINPLVGGEHDGKFYHLGDLFINGDGAGGGLLAGNEFVASNGAYTSDLNDPFHSTDDDGGPWTHPGAALYGIDSFNDVHFGTNEGGFGLDAAIADANNPFAVRDNGAFLTNLGGITVNMTSHDYGTRFGADEDDTWIIEWNIDLALFGGGFDPELAVLHLTTECVNDFLDTDQEPVVPEPATMSLIGLGLASWGIMRRRKNSC